MASFLSGPDEPVPNEPAPNEPAGFGLSIAVEPGDPEPVLRVAGELDLTSAHRLRRAVTAVLAGQPPALVVDLSGLTFTDCAGLRVLAEARRRQAASGHQLRIVGIRPHVRRLMRLTGFDAHLTGSPSVPAPRTDPAG